MATKVEKSCNYAAGGHHSEESDGSLCFSDAEDQSWHSPHGSHCASTHGIDLEIGVPEACCVISGSSSPEIRVFVDKVEKDCRICHLGLESEAHESGITIKLGCSCKDDLAAAHKQCAETWFKIKGNKICEICGSTARNVVAPGEPEVIEQPNEANSTAPPAPPTEARRSFWQGHRVLNFLLACMVFAFVISWLFHFNVRS